MNSVNPWAFNTCFHSLKRVNRNTMSTDKIDESLKYVLGMGTVDMIIVGFELHEQIDNYIGRVKNALISKK